MNSITNGGTGPRRQWETQIWQRGGPGRGGWGPGRGCRCWMSSPPEDSACHQAPMTARLMRYGTKVRAKVNEFNRDAAIESAK